MEPSLLPPLSSHPTPINSAGPSPLVAKMSGLGGVTPTEFGRILLKKQEERPANKTFGFIHIPVHKIAGEAICWSSSTYTLVQPHQAQGKLILGFKGGGDPHKWCNSRNQTISFPRNSSSPHFRCKVVYQALHRTHYSK